ncbi:MAG: RhuM family protein [Phycisphaerae bacterium]
MSEPGKPRDGQIILYRTTDGAMKVEITYLADTFWLSQRKIAELFAVDVRTVNEHLRNIYESGELAESATIRKFRRVQREGNRDVAREIDFYNLDAIISVGYRVNSGQATQFRIWATQTLREFIIKGFVLDDERADASKPAMGLTTWKNAPGGKVLRSDVAVAKNYLVEDEISELERIVGMYLDYAENQARRQIPMTMADWVERLDAFLRFNEYEALTNAGKVSAEVAKKLAEEQYDIFRVRQDKEFEGDFEKEIKRIAGRQKPGKGEAE